MKTCKLERDVSEQARNGSLCQCRAEATVRRVRCLPRREARQGEPRADGRVRRGAVGHRERSPRRRAASTITRETIEGFQARWKMDGVSNRTVNMDVGALRKVLKRYGHWRRLQDHVKMLSEVESAPIRQALTPEEQKRLHETAASNPEWEHVYCAAVLAANTSMRGVEVKHVRPKDVDLEKMWGSRERHGQRRALPRAQQERDE
jgi:integrase